MNVSFSTVLRAVIAWSAMALVFHGFAIAQTPKSDQPAAHDKAAQKPSPEDVEFFERKVRPLLIENCSECHGADDPEAGLRLDSRLAVTQGSTSGAVIVPGKAEQSRLIEVVRYEGSVQMPPDGKLDADQIALLTKWISRGAAWPEPPDATSEGQDKPKGKPQTLGPSTYEQTRATHWAFQPIRHPAPPHISQAAWARTPIDRFILARLESAGLAPSPAADRRTLIRRLYFDLIGLPPSPEEVEAFFTDPAPDAYERIVDRLLASPHYGERWGRHWLDVARYADTKGYVFTAEPRYAFSYTYRDYVIRALNDDLPFDRFIIEQLAADLVVGADDRSSLAALGFLTLGRRFNNNIPDIIDDRIDVVSRGLLGLTVGCARCHDHKYDPIPTADYYSLYGVFASSVEPGEMPLIAPPEQTEAYNTYMQELAKRQAELDRFIDENVARVEDQLRGHVAEYLLRVIGARPERLLEKGAFLSLSAGDLRPSVVRRWRDYLASHAKADQPVFGLWRRFAELPADRFASASAELIASVAAAEAGDGASSEPAGINRLVHEEFVAHPPASMADVARVYGQLLSGIDAHWREVQHAHAGAVSAGTAAGEPPKQLEDSAAEQLRQVLYAEDSPTRVPRDKLVRLLDRELRNKLRKLQMALDHWKAESPDAPPRAMALVDRDKPVEPHIFLRGNPHRLGAQVPRRFLAVLSGPRRTAFQQGSGRLELARAIASSDNPLTARVIVNRVWQHHFGKGLVRTPSNFGTRGDLPTHPDLLDYLASTLIEDGWSLKRLHRRILLSSVYQQASVDRSACKAKDVENRLLWKMNRRPLEFEPLRDAMLAVTGELDQTVGGRPVKLFGNPSPPRRTVYGFIDRQDLPNLLRVFNFAGPDSSAPGRPETIVPQQALFMMNAPFVIECARHLAARPEICHESDPATRVQMIFRLALGREASERELAAALKFVDSTGDQPAANDATEPVAAAPPAEGQPMTPWQRLAQTLLMTNEFAFVD